MSSAMTTQRATLIGLLAPLCWGMGVSLVRGIAESQRELAMFHARYLFFCWRNADDGGGHGELPLARSDAPFCRGL